MTPFDAKEFNEANLRTSAGLQSYSPFQLLFLLRLARLLRERQDWARKLNSGDWRIRLLNKAIYSTFCDCVEQGVAEDARSLFEQNRAQAHV
jgi:hypothetical protein